MTKDYIRSSQDIIHETYKTDAERADRLCYVLYKEFIKYIEQTGTDEHKELASLLL